MVFPARRLYRALAAAAMAALLALQAGFAHGEERAAAEYVRLALAHEACGKEEMSRHFLEAALTVAPDYAPAHWHLGHVQVDGRWVAAADTHAAAVHDATLATYRKLRDEGLDDPRRELALARWCKRQGWEDLEELHYSRVLLNPAANRRIHSQAMRALDLVRSGGELLSEEELAHREEEADRVEAAMLKWREPLEEWGRSIAAGDPTEATLAAEELDKLDDPAVIPVLTSFVFESGPVFGRRLVAQLGTFPQQEATQGLARYAILSPSDQVRDAAISELKERPLHAYVPLLLDSLAAPVHSRFWIAFGRGGNVAYQHVLVQRHADRTHVVKREHLTLPIQLRAPFRIGSTGAFSPGQAVAEFVERLKLALFHVRAAAARIEGRVARENATALMNNEPIFVALERTTGEALAREPAQWQSWWEQYNEVPREKPTYYEYIPTHSTYFIPPRPGGSCFSAGTPVWTEAGLVPIETVRVGDRVLSQDLDSGELTYKLVLRTTALPPTSDTVRVAVDAESVDMTRAHVVWVNGKGWRMAKELVPGDRLHGVSSALPVRGVDELPPELEVYNLVVADFNTFFVGESGMLVHDITYMTRRKPTTAIVPGLTSGSELGESVSGNSPPRSLVRQIRSGQPQ